MDVIIFIILYALSLMGFADIIILAILFNRWDEARIKKRKDDAWNQMVESSNNVRKITDKFDDLQEELRRAEQEAVLKEILRVHRFGKALRRWRASKSDGFNNRIMLRRFNFDRFVEVWEPTAGQEGITTDPVRLFGIEPYLKRGR